MLEGLISFAWYSSYGDGAIGEMLYEWEQAGFFSYLLPFLLIFSLVFGILTQIKLFKENKAINGIIALVVALMALQFDLVPVFFSELFPRLGVGLAILLVVLILVGMFADPENNAIMYSIFGVGVIIVIVILIQTAGIVGWSTGWWWGENWPMVAGVVILFIIIGIIIGGSKGGTADTSKSPLAKALRGE